MSPKPNFTITSRFLEESRRIAVKRTPSPFPDPPTGRRPIGRLCFDGPSPKLDWPIADLANAIAVDSLQDAIFFLDTNIFTTQLDLALWNAFCKRRIIIVPAIWNELQPWLKTPFCNQTIRDSVVAAAQGQVARAGKPQTPTDPNIEVLLRDEDENFVKHGYEYYLKLLTLRKVMGPLASAVLTKTLGRAPTREEFLAEVQGNLGERGFLMARKGSDAANSPNRITDETFVVTAVLTAIMRGSEVFIVSRDVDVLEQYFKLLVLMKEHYRAMLAAEQYAANPNAMAFQQMPIGNDGVHVPPFTGTSFLQFETTDQEFNPLPSSFHFVNIYCLLLGGEPERMKTTFASFCAETEMARVLQVKAATGGLSTDKLGGRNCLIHTSTLTPTNHEVIVSIGKERTQSFAGFGPIGVNDLHNTLFSNELSTKIFYDDPANKQDTTA